MGTILGHYIMPHPPIAIKEVGKGEEEKIKATRTACDRIGEEIGKLRPDTIIIITPHGPLFSDALAVSTSEFIEGSMDSFNAPEVKFKIPIDTTLTESIREKAIEKDIILVPIDDISSQQYGISSELDHGSMVPLYFINERYKDYNLVHITYGLLSKGQLYKFGMAIEEAVKNSDKKAVVIASGDLSHKLSVESPYGIDENGIKFDEEIIELLSSGDVLGVFGMDRKLIKGAGECGLRSFYILLGTMDGYEVKGELLSYEGPFGIGYGVMKFDTKASENNKQLKSIIKLKQEEIEKIRACEDVYAKLARGSLEYYVKTGEYGSIPIMNEKMFNERHGVFVSIKKEGELRGCIGSIFPTTDCIAREIIKFAVEAGQRDPRFSPVEEEELEDLEYSIDILMTPIKASKEELDPKRYGVIVRCGSRSGVLLPDLEGVDTVEDQLSIALEKAGIDKYEEYSIERFEVLRRGSKC
jgi:AmmeMemoRadiSam system protein A/AmmeMemoRadiSam system protein B